MKQCIGGILVVCLVVMVSGEVWACSCARGPLQFEQFLVDKHLPSNAPGVGVIATHWPKHVRVMPKSVTGKVQLYRLKGKRRIKVPFVVQYLGHVRAKAISFDQLEKVKIKSKDLKSIKPVKPLTTKQKHIRALYENTYIIKPTKGFSPGQRYEVSVRSPVSWWRLSKKARKAKQTEKVFTTQFEVDKKALKQKTFSVKYKSERATVSVPGGAFCSRLIDADTVHMVMSVPDRYKHMFLYSVFANGALYSPNVSLCSTTTLGRSLVAPLAQERFYTPDLTCVQTRTYKLDVVVAWPGTSTVWWDKPQEVKLDCTKNSLRR